MELTKDIIINEIENVPEDKLEELYHFVERMTSRTKNKDNRERILSYAGMLSDMSDKDYKDFEEETKKTRNNLFTRKIDL